MYPNIRPFSCFELWLLWYYTAVDIQAAVFLLVFAPVSPNRKVFPGIQSRLLSQANSVTCCHTLPTTAFSALPTWLSVLHALKFLPKSCICTGCGLNNKQASVTGPLNPTPIASPSTQNQADNVAADLATITSTLNNVRSELNTIGEIKQKLSSLDRITSTLEQCLLCLENHRSSVLDLNQRVDSISSAQHQLATRCDEIEARQADGINEIIAEVNDRQVRAAKLIIHGLPESESTAPDQSKKHDAEGVSEILASILPSENLLVKTRRLGKLKGGSPRPLCVGLKSADSVKSILRNKSKYTGPCKITDDKTRTQRLALDQLRTTLRELHEKGEIDKTIRYVRGEPTIVSTGSTRDRSPKNA